MNIFIIFCHPDRQSYTGEILVKFTNECLAKGWNVETSDLYAMNFQSDMTTAEYKRESLAQLDLAIAEDVLQEHKKIAVADVMVFIYPVWWGDCPAKLKGWFDRVYTVGYAYKQQEGFPKMKTLEYGFALCTAGYTVDYLSETGMAQSMRTIMLHDRFGQRFKQKEMIILGGTLDKVTARQQHELQVNEVIEKIAALADLY